MNDRFQDLRTSVAVVQGRGFATAAERLGLGKSAVSRRVRELEERLSTRLLHRTTRSISLTDAGGKFYWPCAFSPTATRPRRWAERIVRVVGLEPALVAGPLSDPL